MSREWAISHSAGPCETARVLDGGLGCAHHSVWQWAASPVPCRISPDDISVWKRGCDRPRSGLLVCITNLSRLSHAICQTVNWTVFWLGSHKGRQTNMCMLTETMRGKLRVERRRVLNHNPNTGSYWVVSTGTALRESGKNIDLLKCEMCFAQRRATTAARLLKERQPPISVNKRNKLLTHKGLSTRLTAKG